MAPELMDDQAKRTDYDGAMVDVFSFGLVMYALLSRYSLLIALQVQSINSILTILSREKPYARMISRHKLNIWTLRDRVVRGLRPDVEGLEVFESFSSPAPPGALKIMLDCWQSEPFDRPSGFDEIQERLLRVIRARASRESSHDQYAENARDSFNMDESHWKPGAITSRDASPSMASSVYGGRECSPSVASSLSIQDVQKAAV
jgi:hypothetical protein